MLSPETRRLYSECFQTPEGYRFDCAVGTTFSLDLESLLFVQLALATNGWGDPEAALRDPVSLTAAIHTVAHRVSLFCQEGETNVPHQPSSLYALLEACIHGARGRGGGALFHPKVWVLRFVPEQSGSAYLRVVVLSRNLTVSRAWDTLICLEGVPGRTRQQPSRDLASLIRALPELCRVGSVSSERRAQLELLARDADTCLFSSPFPFEGVAHFLACGIQSGQGFEPVRNGERVLAISPFVSPATLTALAELAPHRQLISRPEEMSKCGPEAIALWDAWSIDDSANADADRADSHGDVTTIDVAPSGLHAKALAVERGAWTTWWIGSGNLTDAVRSGANVELMVRLEGRTRHVGPEKFLEAGFAKLLREYTYEPPPVDPQEGHRAAIRKTIAALVDAHMTLHCAQQAESWTLLLRGSTDHPTIVTITARPITLPRHRELQIVPGSLELRFEALTLEALSSLVAFRLDAGEGEAGVSHEFTLKLPIENLPPERDAQITRSIIKNRAAFLNYLRCVLIHAGEGELTGAIETTEGVAGWSARSSAAHGVLEDLMRTLHRSPERLRCIESLFDHIRPAEPNEESPIPEEFIQVWVHIAPIVKARLAARMQPS